MKLKMKRVFAALVIMLACIGVAAILVAVGAVSLPKVDVCDILTVTEKIE